MKSGPMENRAPSSRIKVVIARDRLAAGGGIHNYFRAIQPHLRVVHEFCDVGRPHFYYGNHSSGLSQCTGWRLMSDWWSLFRKVLRGRPDIVHVNPGLDSSVGRSLKRDAVSVLIARLLGRRVLVFWRGWENSWCGQPEFPGGNRGWLCRIYKQAAAHVVLAARFKDDLRRWGFRTPIHVETTLVADECLAAPPRSFTPDTATTNLLFLSRIEVAKGLFELIEAYRILKQRNPAYTLTVAGDGPALEDLKKRAAEMDLRDITFPGYLQGPAKLDCYRQGSIFCFLSYTEGMPNAVLEAMASGLPVVSSDAGGLRDILSDQRTGFVLVPQAEARPKEKFDPNQVAGLIDRLAQDRELYQRVSEHNARYTRERFGAAQVAKRLESIYASVEAEERASCADGAGSSSRPLLFPRPRGTKEPS